MEKSQSSYIIMLFVSILLLVFMYSVDGKKNQFRINFDEISSCNDFTNDLVDMSAVTLEMDENENVLAQGKIELRKAIEKGPWMIESEIFKESGLKYVKVLSHVVDDLCPDLMDEERLWYKYLLKLDPEPSKSCPIAPGTYKVLNMKADPEGMSMSRDMVGKYRVEVRMKLPDDQISAPKLAFCYQIFLVVEAY